jgi:hypothetical protein
MHTRCEAHSPDEQKDAVEVAKATNKEQDGRERQNEGYDLHKTLTHERLILL